MHANRVLMLLSNAYDPDPRVRQEAVSLLGMGCDIRILAWDRDLKAAARESMGYVLEEDVPDEIAQCSLVLAEVLQAAGREAQAREAALSALRVSQARENAIFTQKASEFLASATAPTVARRPRVA